MHFSFVLFIPKTHSLNFDCLRLQLLEAKLFILWDSRLWFRFPIHIGVSLPVYVWVFELNGFQVLVDNASQLRVRGLKQRFYPVFPESLSYVHKIVGAKAASVKFITYLSVALRLLQLFRFLPES